MALIIDIQGFRGKDNEFIPKEIAIMEEDFSLENENEESLLFFIKSPYDLRELPRDIRRQNLYLAKVFHGISWERSGTMDIKSIEEYLQTNYKSRLIYCKGAEKCHWVCKVLCQNSCCVINLEKYDCPSIKVLRKDFGMPVHCQDHKGVCAKENVHLFKYFIKERIRKSK